MEKIIKPNSPIQQAHHGQLRYHRGNEQLWREETETGFTDRQLITWKLLQREATQLSIIKNYTPHRGHPGIPLTRHPQKTKKEEAYYAFSEFFPGIECEITHFQLPLNIRMVDEHNVYLTYKGCVARLNELTGELSEINDKLQVAVSSFAIFEERLHIGTLHGDLFVLDLSSGSILDQRKITFNDSFVNDIDIHSHLTNPTILISGNDGFIRYLNLDRLDTPIWAQHNPVPINAARLWERHNVIAYVGDWMTVNLIDARGPKRPIEFRGHQDDCFSVAWHPSKPIFATTSQDLTCRIWDLRQPKSAYQILPGVFSTTNSPSFSPNGKYLTFSEDRSYVHVYDVSTDFAIDQEINVVGQVPGVCFSGITGESLFFGVRFPDHSGIFKYSLTDQIDSKKESHLEDIIL